MQKNPLKPVVSLHPMVRIDSAQAPLSNGVLTSIPIFLSLESFQHDSVDILLNVTQIFKSVTFSSLVSSISTPFVVELQLHCPLQQTNSPRCNSDRLKLLQLYFFLHYFNQNSQFV
jgi:hypothetical protein